MLLGTIGATDLACSLWHVTDSVSELQIQESSLLSPRLTMNWLLQRVELCVQYVLTVYAVMYCGVRRPGWLTLMLIKCVYSCWSLIEAGVASWCWRLLLCVAAPCLPVETVFPVTWGLSLAGEPVEAGLGEEMTRWFEIAANPVPALLPE